MGNFNNDEGLFRKEALQAFSERHYGRPIARFPRLWTALVFALCLMIIITGVFLATSTYARKEKVVGWLSPDQGLARLTANQFGVIDRVLVEEGQVVSRGDDLFIISLDARLENGGKAVELVLVDLGSEIEEIETQLSLIRSQSDLKHKETQYSLERMVAERGNLQTQLTVQNERVAIAADLLARYTGLFSEDAASAIEVARQQEALAVQKQNRASLSQKTAAMEREIGALRAALEREPVETEQALSELRAQLSALAQRRTELERQGRIVIAAPIDGHIASLSGKVGAAVAPQDALGALVPEGSVLFAQVYVPSRAIGFVEAGQRVRLMYEPFPHQRYGAAWGELVRISDTVLSPDELPLGLGLEEPAYKASVRLDKNRVEAFGRSFALRPGMALSAEIIQERRTFLQFLMEPLRARRDMEQ